MRLTPRETAMRGFDLGLNAPRILTLWKLRWKSRAEIVFFIFVNFIPSCLCCPVAKLGRQNRSKYHSLPACLPNLAAFTVMSSPDRSGARLLAPRDPS